MRGEQAKMSYKHGDTNIDMRNDKTLTIRLPGGDIIKTSNRAKKMDITISEAVRLAVKMWNKWHDGYPAPNLENAVKEK